MGIIKEFKEFSMKGNMLDMAVGIIIGGAFGKIVASLVNDVIMPPIGYFLGGVDFKDLVIPIKGAVMNDLGEIIAPAVTMNYGNFIQTFIDFLIIAFAVFMLIKGMNRLKRRDEKKATEPAAPPAPTKEEILLTEIRDLLKNK